MTDNLIVPSPTFDLLRVAEAVRRQVRLDIDPVFATAALHGMPVELSEDQSRQVAAVALAVLVAAHPIDGKAWLIDANQEWVRQADQAARRYRNASLRVRSLRGSVTMWREYASWSWAYFLSQSARIEWHWPWWTVFSAVLASTFFSAGIRRRERRRAERAGEQ